jgi:hypothetical protein
MREYAACVRVRRAYFVRPSIDRTRTYTVYVYTMHACIYMHARLATPMNGSPMRARRTHARTCCVRARARVCVCDWARACVRVRLGAHASAPTRASAFRRRHRPRVASARRHSRRRRRSTRTSARGTPPQCQTCSRYAPPFRPGGAPLQAGALDGSSMRRGPLCAAAPRMRSRVCQRRRVGTRMRGCPRVWYSCTYERRVLCTYVYPCIYMYALYIYT